MRKFVRANLLFLYSLFFPIIGNCTEESTGSRNTMKTMKENILLDYALERESLSADQIDDILHGRLWPHHHIQHGRYSLYISSWFYSCIF